MTPRLAVALLVAALGLAACGDKAFISPNDPQYARTGAPRAGEPMQSPDALYGRILGSDSRGPS